MTNEGKRGSLGPCGYEMKKIFQKRETTNNVSRASETAPFKRYEQFKFWRRLSTYQGVKCLEKMLKSDKNIPLFEDFLLFFGQIFSLFAGKKKCEKQIKFLGVGGCSEKHVWRRRLLF